MKRNPSLRTKSDTGLKMHIFSRPDHQYACAQTDSRMMQARSPPSSNHAAKNISRHNGAEVRFPPRRSVTILCHVFHSVRCVCFVCAMRRQRMFDVCVMQITKANKSVAVGAMDSHLRFCRRQVTGKPKIYFGLQVLHTKSRPGLVRPGKLR
jgi:hypothetical protein